MKMLWVIAVFLVVAECRSKSLLTSFTGIYYCSICWDEIICVNNLLNGGYYGRSCVVIYILSFPGIDSDPKQSCKFGSKTVANGEVAMSVPEKCLSLICREGKIKKQMTGEPGDTGCK